MTTAFSRLRVTASELPKWIKLKKDIWYKAIIKDATMSPIFKHGKKVWLKENTEIPYQRKSYWVYSPGIQKSMCISDDVFSDYATLYIENRKVVPATPREQSVLDAHWKPHIEERIKLHKNLQKKAKKMKTLPSLRHS